MKIKNEFFVEKSYVSLLFLLLPARVKEMEEEAEKIKQIQSEVDQQVMGSPPGGTAASSKTMLSLEDKMEIDTRSIFVGNVSQSSNTVLL